MREEYDKGGTQRYPSYFRCWTKYWAKLWTLCVERKMDRKVVSVVSLAEKDAADKRYWRSKSPRERLQAVEETRQMIPRSHPTSVNS
jgi:hypothetical protein